MLAASINRTNSLGWNPRPGSPTVYVNGNCIYGYPPCQALDPTTSKNKKKFANLIPKFFLDQVLQFICQQYTGTKPAACSSVLNEVVVVNKNRKVLLS